MSRRVLRALPLLLLGALALFVVIVAPISIDSGAFMHLGRLVLRGQTPYLDGWDHKGPILYLANAAALAVTADSPRGVLLVELALTALALRWSMRRWDAWVGAAASAGIATAFVLSYAMFWSGGNLSETWFLPIQLVAYTALGALLLDDAGARTWRWTGALIGLAGAIGLASRMNNTVGLAAAAAGVILWRRDRAVGFAVAAVGAIVVVIAPLVLALKARGALDAMVDQYWWFNSRYNTITVPFAARVQNATFLLLLFVRTPLVFALGIAIARGWQRRAASGPAAMRLVLAAGIVVLEFAVQLISGQGFRHYLLSPLPALAMLAVLVLHESVARSDTDRTPQSTVGSGSRAALARVGWGMVGLLYALSTVRALDAMRVRAVQASSVGDTPLARVAAEVVRVSPAGAPILGTLNAGAVLGLTGRPSATRYFNDYPLLVPGYGPPRVEEFARELDTHPPAVIIRTPGSCEIVAPDPACMPASQRLAERARGHYRRTLVVGDYEVWAREP